MLKSNTFDHSDDPAVVEILKKEKAEAKKVLIKAKEGSKYVNGVKKMMEFSQKIVEELETLEDRSYSPPLSPSVTVEELDSSYSPPPSPSLMVSPKMCRKVSFIEEYEIEEDSDDDSNEYIPDLDELLKLPERPSDGSKTKDEILDEFDQQIAEKQRLHDEEMDQVDAVQPRYHGHLRVCVALDCSRSLWTAVAATSGPRIAVGCVLLPAVLCGSPVGDRRSSHGERRE